LIKIMAVTTKLHIFTTDGQEYTEIDSFYITPIAFAAAQTLPTATLITAYINAVYGASTQPSSQIVYGYSVEVIELPTGVIGGDGEAATAIAIKTRNAVGTLGKINRLGVPEGIEHRIPGLDKASVVFDPVNPNSIVVNTTEWAAVRTALVALGYQDDQGNVIPSGEIIMTATAFNGKRAPKRPR
jgi:hypothetical protein